MSEQLTITVRGREYPVEVQVGRAGKDAYFKVQITENKWVAETTWEAMYKKAMKITKELATTVEVPFSEVRGNSVSHGIATGLHAGTGNVLVRWESGGTTQYESWGRGNVMRALNAEERAECERLLEAAAKAEKARDDFISEHRLDETRSLKTHVTKLVENAAAEAMIGESA